MSVTRRAMLTAGLAALVWPALAWPAQAEAPVTALRPRARPVPTAPPTLDDLLRAAGLSGDVGLILADTATGRVIEARAANGTMAPASTAKAITALYALAALGPDHRFQTRLIATGPVVDGTLAGDLILAGGGDPVLTTDHLATMAADLRAAGVRRVSGAFRVWGGALPAVFQIDPGQLPQLGYNPAISGLNLNFNRVHFGWEPTGVGDWRITMDARTELYRPDVTVAQVRIADRDLPVYTYEERDGIDRWSVARSALTEGGSRWLPVRHPALYAGEVFGVMAAAQGIGLRAARTVDALPDGVTLVVQHSDPLDAIIRDMLDYSTNITAEILGLTASIARGALPASLAGSATMMNAWAQERLGIGTAFVDHSGLGDGSRVSPAQMVRALVSAYAGGQLPLLLESIALLDDAGEVLVNPPGVVVAKTGTLNFVSALAGYLRTPHGAGMAFVIFAADPDQRAQAKASGQEVPEGGRAWARRARALQQDLLQRWAVEHG